MGPHFLPLVCLMAATQRPSSKYGGFVVARSAAGQSHFGGVPRGSASPHHAGRGALKMKAMPAAPREWRRDNLCEGAASRRRLLCSPRRRRSCGGSVPVPPRERAWAGVRSPGRCHRRRRPQGSASKVTDESFVSDAQT